jgi:hypothetical protein
LIHIEQLWSENLFTAEGRIMHDKVDTANRESRGNIRIEYGVPLRSLRLGLIDDCHNIVDTFSCHDIVDSHQFCSAGITTCN